MTMQEVQLQRSPYAGSTNRFRRLPVNISPVTSTVVSTVNSPSIATQTRGIDPTKILTTSSTFTERPAISINEARVPLPVRFDNRNLDQYQDYDHHQHHFSHRHHRERNFDYNYDY